MSEESIQEESQEPKQVGVPFNELTLSQQVNILSSIVQKQQEEIEALRNIPNIVAMLTDSLWRFGVINRLTLGDQNLICYHQDQIPQGSVLVPRPVKEKKAKLKKVK